MRLFELHNALARTIGDPVQNTGSLFVDGIRYSTRLRAQYLAQAMNDIVMAAVQKVSMLPHKEQSEVIERMFPSMVTQLSSVLPIDITDCAFVLSAYYTNSLLNPLPTALPIVRSFQAVRGSLGRNSTMQPSDPFLIYADNDALQVSGANTESLLGAVVTINHIKRPQSHEWLADVANANEEMNQHFEPMWKAEVLRKASLFALIDSGEAGVAPQYYPLVQLPT